MKQVLFIDLDGVIIKARHRYFSERLAEEHNIPLGEVLKFFQNEYGDAARGKVSIRESLPPYLAAWGWSGDLDSFLAYWFDGEKDVDQAVLEDIAQLRAQGIKVYIVSDNERERADYLEAALNLSQVVDGAFYSYQLGTKKSEPAFFSAVLEQLEVTPEAAAYLDDDPKNVEVGRQAGITSEVYTPEMRVQEIAELKLR